MGLLIFSRINQFPYPVNDGSARKDEQWKTKQKRTRESHSTNVNKYVIMAVVLCNVLVNELSELKKKTTVNAGQKQGIDLKSGFSKACVNILTSNSLCSYCEMDYLPSTTSLIQCSNCFKSSTGHLQGCGKAQKNFRYVHICICHNQPSFHWLLYWRYVIWDLFQHKRVFHIFLYFRQEEQSKRIFWFFFCFSFWRGHSLDLEVPRKPIQWVKDPKKACDLILMRFNRLIFMRWRQKAKTARVNGVNIFFRKVMNN